MVTTRSNQYLAITLGAVMGATGACEMDWLGLKDGFTETEWDLIRAIQPLATPMPANPSNRFAFDDTAATFGQMLFFDPDFSTAIKVDGPSGAKGVAGRVACVNCHDPNRFFIDSRTTEGLSHGVDFTSRSSPTMVNIGWYTWVTWTGRLDSLCMQGANAPESPTDVGTSRLFYAHVLFAKYRDLYDALFSETPLDAALDRAHADAARFPPAGRPKAAPADPDGPWEMMAPGDRRVINEIMANSGKALEAYERKLVSTGSPFERFARGDADALTLLQKQGLRVFIGKAACNECHSGPVLSDNRFHNIGVPQIGTRVPAVDSGRFGDIPRLLANPYRSEEVFSDDPEAGKARLDEVRALETDGAGVALEETRGQFRTAGLLNVAETAPYFHDGSAKTLEAVVGFYNRGGGDLGTYSGSKDRKMAPLHLTEKEETELVSFLRSLTGDHAPAEWRANTARPTLPPPPPP